MLSPGPNFMNWDSPGWAVITGASSGIGEEFARRLAAQGFSLLLAARRKDRLESLAQSLSVDPGVGVEVFPVDLCRPKDVERLVSKLLALGEIDVLVLNAGFGTVAPFCAADLEGQLAMLTLHNVDPIILARTVLPKMIQRNRGVIIFTASLSAFVPSPGAGLYTPTKAFLVGLAKTLSWELKETAVRVQALCPGHTRTEFHEGPAYDGLRAFLPKYAWGTSDRVVRASLRGAFRGRRVVIPGMLNRLTLKVIPEGVMLRPFMKKRWRRVRDHQSAWKHR